VQHFFNKNFYATIGKHSHQATLSCSSCPGATESFENMIVSFTMIGSPFATMKNKRVARTTNLVLAFEGGFMFYLGN